MYMYKYRNRPSKRPSRASLPYHFCTTIVFQSLLNT